MPEDESAKVLALGSRNCLIAARTAAIATCLLLMMAAVAAIPVVGFFSSI